MKITGSTWNAFVEATGEGMSFATFTKGFEAALTVATNAPEQTGTPGAKWRENGEPDPHGNQYNCERAGLALGTLTDDELANAVFLHGN